MTTQSLSAAWRQSTRDLAERGAVTMSGPTVLWLLDECDVWRLSALKLTGIEDAALAQTQRAEQLLVAGNGLAAALRKLNSWPSFVSTALRVWEEASGE